jgi:hypothetical protein
MATKRDRFVASIERLEQALAGPSAGNERGWRNRVDQALAEVAVTARQHAASLEGPDIPLVDVDRPLLPSPGVARRSEELRQQLDGFALETQALRIKLRAMPPAAEAPANVANLAGALPVAPDLAAAVDFGVFRGRARKLCQALEHYEEEEAALILDSINTEVGAGD